MDINKQEEFTKTIRHKYPELFKNKWVEISVGPGWFPFVERAAELLNDYKGLDPDIQFEQIKEKFATLRIYVDAHNLSREAFC